MKRSFEQGGKKNNSNKRETCEPQMKPRNVLLDLLAAQSMSGATSDMLLISGKGDCVQSPLRESTTHHDRLLLLLDIVYTSTSTEDPTAQNNRGEKNLLSSFEIDIGPMSLGEKQREIDRLKQEDRLKSFIERKRRR